ncbi:hypothetical protein JTE90_022685 [Oedothorax gibbosus]|uniref:Uncharacterized protein n=1 Tax=Oedothorax gibbosus TaxID=931172 RepID=A0AAV6UKG7_9ARAC|nr:hypothetical protein JTE90_022685 [Oedothorax gibbosus]
MSRSLKQNPTINRPLQGTNGLAYTDEEKAEAFADEMEKQFQVNTSPTNTAFEESVQKEVNAFLRNQALNLENDPTDLEEIMYIIGKLKRQKAPGLDNINNSILKTSLSRLFNEFSTSLMPALS